MVQFGDVEYKDGDGGVSSFKKKFFADENFDVGTQPRKGVGCRLLYSLRVNPSWFRFGLWT